MINLQSEVPTAYHEPVAAALGQAFPGGTVEAVAPLHGGQSGALIYKVLVDGRPAVLRIVTERTALNHPPRQFRTMQLAAERGVAPTVFYADPDAGICISTFIPSQPAIAALRADPALAAHFGQQLRQLHSGPAFPEFLDGFQMIQGGRDQAGRARRRAAGADPATPGALRGRARRWHRTSPQRPATTISIPAMCSTTARSSG